MNADRAAHLAAAAPRIAVIGAGVAGLTAAYRLQQAGHAVSVYEAAGQPGGRTLTLRRNGYVFDVGAIALLPTYVQTCALVHELGIGAHLHHLRPVIGIPRGGQVHGLDLARPVHSLWSTRLLSAGAKLRLLKLAPAMKRAWHLADFDSMGKLAPWDHESAAAFARRVLGEEGHEFLAGPILRGNTLNDTDQAPAAELLWMLRQYAAASVSALDMGINGLAEALAGRVPVTYGTRITRVTRDGAGVGVGLEGEGPQGPWARRVDACVVALPPPDLLALAPPMAEGQRRFLHGVRPMPSLSLHIGLRRAPPGRREAFILPPHGELTTLVLDHHKAPGRAPAGQGVMTCMLRDAWSTSRWERDDAELLDEVLRLAQPFVGDVRGDVETFHVQRWAYANVKSQVGLYRGMAGYEAAMDPASPVQLAGDFLSQGIESAVLSGQAAASRLTASLGRTAPPQFLAESQSS